MNTLMEERRAKRSKRESMCSSWVDDPTGKLLPKRIVHNVPSHKRDYKVEAEVRKATK